MNTPNAYMSLKVVLSPPVNSSGAHHARVVAILPPPAEAVIDNEAIMCTAPPKSHTCSSRGVSAWRLRGGSGGAGYLGAAVARAQHVVALDVAVDDADEQVVQVGEGARSLTRSPDALVCGRGELLSQRVEPAAARHPLHDDEGVGRFQTRSE